MRPNDIPQAIERLAPALPTDLDIIGPGVGRPGRVRGRQADHEQAVVGELGGFRQRLGKAELGLEAAGGKVALVVQLAGVGHPFVDEDEAGGTVLVEKLAQCIARIRRLLVVGRNPSERLLAAQLPTPVRPRGFERPCRPPSSPDSPAKSCCRPAPPGVPSRAPLLAPPAARRRFQPVPPARSPRTGGTGQAWSGSCRHRSWSAIERRDRRLDPRRGGLPRPAGPFRLSVRYVRRKNSTAVPVLVRPFAQVYLPEVGRELGLLVAPARDVLVGCDDLPPWLEAGGDSASDGGARLPSPFPACLLVEAHPQQLHLEPLELIRLRRRYRGEETAHRIQCPIGVIAGEALLVGPLVAVAAQLTDETPFRRPENRAKDVVPGLPHQLEQPGHVPLGHGLVRQY